MESSDTNVYSMYVVNKIIRKHLNIWHDICLEKFYRYMYLKNSIIICIKCTELQGHQQFTYKISMNFCAVCIICKFSEGEKVSGKFNEHYFVISQISVNVVY